MAAEAGRHSHEIVMIGVTRKGQLEVLRMRNSVVTDSAVNLALFVDLMIDQDALGRRDRPILTVALQALS